MIAELEALDGFRAEVRQWFGSHVPRDWQTRMRGASGEVWLEFARQWLAELREGGFAAPHWPSEWGGGGNSLAEQIVIAEEMAGAGAPRLSVFFVSLYHAAATLLAAGSEEQRRRHLPAILDGQIWCQGFSEPDAGSDLAAMRTRAELRDDVYVVNGQKVWSSGANRAEHCLLLARTNPDVPKHRGISYFLLDMASPGVDVRPIRDAKGNDHFCEVFLQNVEIPLENRVGEENEGWRIAQSTLSSERGVTILELAERLRIAFGWLVELARERDPGGRRRVDDVEVRRELAQLHAELESLRLLVNRMLTDLLRGGGVGPESSILKLYYSELLQRFMEFGTRLAGPRGQLFEPELQGSGWESGSWMRDFIGSWEWTIGGGTNEIQRNLVGERALGLPKEPR